jgi:hypothetical protein
VLSEPLDEDPTIERRVRCQGLHANFHEVVVVGVCVWGEGGRVG